MADFQLRPARQEEFPAIRALVRQARINPTGLDWRRFTVAVDPAGRVIACGQVKMVPGGLSELASLVVRTEYRGRGLASTLVEQLLAASPRPLYLTCRAGLGGFYKRFGFNALASEQLPPYYRRLQRLAGVFLRVTRASHGLLVMKLD